MSVEVQAALDVDLDALIQLNRVVQSLHVALYPGDFTPVVEHTCGERVLRSTTCRALTSVIGIAQADRSACGLRLWFGKCRRDRKRRLLPLDPASSVHHIAVAPEARRRGIATALKCAMLSTEQLRRASTKLLWTPGQLTRISQTG